MFLEDVPNFAYRISELSAIERSGNDLVITYGNGDQVAGEGHFGSLSRFSSIVEIQFSDGVTWGRSEFESSVTITGGSGSDTLRGYRDMENRIYGLEGDDRLVGGPLSDLLDGGPGCDKLYGGKGDDTYVLALGSGHDIIDEKDSTPGNKDVLEIGPGVSPEQLWLERAGKDLVASIIGTSDKVTIDDWYRGSKYQVEEFRTSEGQALLNSKVDQVVQAMAAFAPPAPGQTTLPDDYLTTLQPVIAASWK